MTQTLVYLYGLPASGKLTIAEELAAQTGLRLFHNHLTVNAIRSVFDFGSPAFVEVVHRIRLDVFATAMRSGVSLIFTNSSAWGGLDARERFVAFTDEAAEVVALSGGRVLFVHVSAPVAVLERRLANESRRAHNKLLDIDRLRELAATCDDAPLHEDDQVIDTSVVEPAEAARIIAAAIDSRDRAAIADLTVTPPL